MELLNALGLDVKILLAQFFNFAILLLILWKFGYKPMLNFIDERRKTIEEGVENSKKAEVKLEEAEAKYQENIKQAKKEALEIMENAKELGEAKREDMIAKAKEEIGQIIDQEKSKMQAEKAETLREIKEEISGLVIETVEKVLEEKIDDKKDKELIEKTIKKVVT